MMFPSLSRYSSVAYLVLRLAVAAIFLFHGTQKWMFWSAAPEGMSSNMVMMFKALAIIEPLAGVLVLIGLCTQFAALVLAIVMVGAIYFKMTVLKVGFAEMAGTGWEFDMIILAACIALVIEGAGRYSVDAMMKKPAVA